MNKILTLSALLLAASAFAKDYQVTGPVTEMNANSIVVTKGKEKFEIAKSASTKMPADVKVGDKVTVYYSMLATEVEAKTPKKK